MFVQERLDAIAAKAVREKRVTVKELAREFGVSEDLIRKDLTLLEKQGKLQKVYGGAVSVRHNPKRYSSRERLAEHEEERMALAEACMSLIRPDMKLFLDSSLTNARLAALIAASDMRLTVFTNMIPVLNVLSGAKHIKLILFGGELNEERDAFWGSAALEQANRFRYDLAVIGTVGADLTSGDLTTYLEADGVLKHTVMTRSKEVWTAVETHKFSESGDYTWGTLNDLTGIIVEEDAVQQYRNELKKTGIKTLKARKAGNNE